ncbi:uncharacterized protein LOC108903500 [Anoplophora glabripennis]|uniref:uncharacterized protein LOC108903500 n=1 Tax=Anoplophora glabripennis TaxID=217634 RepID=UPI0008758490|nr:uncharacterized protein LOC108903500 [Anoplophora glabripennis]
MKSKRRVTIRKLDMCKGKENLPLQWSNASVSYNEDIKETVFGLNLKVLKEVSNNFSMSFTFWKCDASGNPDSCEYVLKDYKNKEICKYMVMKNQAWTPFMEHFDKPVLCPIKPGEYRLVDCPVKSDFLRLLPIGDAMWKIKLWGFDSDTPISCVDMELQIAPFLGGRRRG